MRKTSMLAMAILIIITLQCCANAELSTVPMNGYGEDWTCAYDPWSDDYYFCVNSDLEIGNIVSGNTVVYRWSESTNLERMFSSHRRIRQILVCDSNIYYRQDTFSMSNMRIGCYNSTTQQHEVVFSGGYGSLLLANEEFLWYTSVNTLFQYSLDEKSHTKLFSAERFYSCGTGIVYVVSGTLYYFDPTCGNQHVIDDCWESYEYAEWISHQAYFYSTGINNNYVISGDESLEIPTYNCALSSMYAVWVENVDNTLVMRYADLSTLSNEFVYTIPNLSINSRPVAIGAYVFFLSKERALPICCVNLTNREISQLR